MRLINWQPSVECDLSIYTISLHVVSDKIKISNFWMCPQNLTCICGQFRLNGTLCVRWNLSPTLGTPTFFIATSVHITACTGPGQLSELSLPGKLNNVCHDPGFIFPTTNTEGKRRECIKMTPDQGWLSVWANTVPGELLFLLIPLRSGWLTAAACVSRPVHAEVSSYLSDTCTP